jgi:hypothetical protein
MVRAGANSAPYAFPYSDEANVNDPIHISFGNLAVDNDGDPLSAVTGGSFFKPQYGSVTTNATHVTYQSNRTLTPVAGATDTFGYKFADNFGAVTGVAAASIRIGWWRGPAGGVRCPLAGLLHVWWTGHLCMPQLCSWHRCFCSRTFPCIHTQAPIGAPKKLFSARWVTAPGAAQLLGRPARLCTQWDGAAHTSSLSEFSSPSARDAPLAAGPSLTTVPPPVPTCPWPLSAMQFLDVERNRTVLLDPYFFIQDPDNDPLDFQIISPAPAHGTLTRLPNGVWQYYAYPSASGVEDDEVVRIKANDGRGGTFEQDITVHISE